MENEHEPQPGEDLKRLEKELHQEEQQLEDLEDELDQEKHKVHELAEKVEAEERNLRDFVYVEVITASGNWPKEGFEKIARHEIVKVFLDKAASERKIVSTQGWVAKVGDKVIQQDRTYAENNLSGEISIDYGPPHTGGGA